MISKTKIFPLFVALSLFSISAIAQDETLSNADIVNLTRAGLGKELIIQKIQITKCNFDTRTSSLISLKTAGVDDRVISAMLSARADLPKPEPPKPEPQPETPPRPEPVQPAPPKPVAITPKTGTNDPSSPMPSKRLLKNSTQPETLMMCLVSMPTSSRTPLPSRS